MQNKYRCYDLEDRNNTVAICIVTNENVNCILSTKYLKELQFIQKI